MAIREPSGPSTIPVRIPSTGRRTRHYRGLPPKVTDGFDLRQDMAPAVLVLAVPDGAGGWDLRRYAADGSDAGNTSHRSWADAVDQLHFEYTMSDPAFTPIPADADDPRSYAAALAARG